MKPKSWALSCLAVSKRVSRLAFCAVAILAAAFAQSGSAQHVAITIDDLPYMFPSRVSPAEGKAQTEAIIDALKAHNAVAVGFTVGQMVNEDTAPAINAFVAAGHKIGNHSWSHPDYDTLWSWQFRRETARAHAALEPWLEPPLYYRFPYLREGKTPGRKAKADAILDELGYTNIPVSIDTQDWRYNADYVAALAENNHAKAHDIARDYVAHMKERSLHYRDLARQEFGRDVAHILLLHLNQINADHLLDVLDWYAQNGWTFISVSEAMQDPLYAMPDLYTGPEGLSQIERVMAEPQD